MALQDGQGHVVVVGITIVERDAGGARGQGARLQMRCGLVQRQHVEPGGQPATDFVEAASVYFVRKQRVWLRQHAVKDQHRQAGFGAGG